MGNIVQIYKQKSPMKLRNGKTLGIEIQDDQCNICFRVKYEPRTLQPCLHSFCSTCLSEAFKNDISHYKIRKCQYCRSVIRNVIHDDQLIKRLKNQYPIDYTERRAAEEKDKRRQEDKIDENDFNSDSSDEEMDCSSDSSDEEMNSSSDS